MDKKGFTFTLEGFVGLVFGMAVAALMLLVIFKFVGVYIPSEEQATPITVFNEINKYKDGQIDVMNFYLESSGFVVGFDKNVKELNLESMSLIATRKETPGGSLSTFQPYVNINKLNKPNACGDKACICKCRIRDLQEKAELENIYILCENIECVNFDDVENIRGKVFLDKEARNIRIDINDEDHNPNNLFIMLINPGRDAEKFFLTLKKQGKTIFIN